MSRNPDPKHGRWVLPLIIGVMVVLTYTFVSSLDPSTDVDGPEDGRDDPPFPTTPTSSTTTLPAEFSSFLVTLDVFEAQATSFEDEVDRINQAWEARSITFQDARNELVDLQATVALWEEEVAEASDVPAQLAESHVALVIASGDLAAAVEDIVLGLEAPDDGTLRRVAVEQFRAEITEVLDAIGGIRDTAAENSDPGSVDETGTASGDAGPVPIPGEGRESAFGLVAPPAAYEGHAPSPGSVTAGSHR